MNRKALVGIGSVMMLLGVVILAVYTLPAFAGSSNPGILYVKGTRISVPLNEEVTVYTTVEAVGGDVSGTLTVYVRKDIFASPDINKEVFYKSIYLRSGETKEIEMGSFIASDLTCEGWCAPGSFRQYFVKVYFNGELIYDPQNPDVRECVETYQ